MWCSSHQTYQRARRTRVSLSCRQPNRHPQRLLAHLQRTNLVTRLHKLVDLTDLIFVPKNSELNIYLAEMSLLKAVES